MAVVMLLMATSASAQTFKAGLGVTLGSGGIGIEGDVAHRRIGVFVRASAGLSSATRMAGGRVYIIGERGSGFYVAGGIAELGCASVTFGGAATSCDGDWHTAGAVLAGVESGSAASTWSLFIDGGPYFGVSDVPGIRSWSFSGGVRIRTR